MNPDFNISAQKSDRIIALGVGGMGMTPLACWLAQAGYTVFGWDANLRQNNRHFLEAAGVHLLDYIADSHFQDCTKVVYSRAIQPDHALLRTAQARSIPIIARGQLLAEISQHYRLVAIAGSHGKTTTSGMLAYLMDTMGFDANYLVGGLFNHGLAPYRYSQNNWMIAEVDESDGTIDDFHPELTVLLNADWDHADYYASESQLIAAFRALAKRTTGKVFICNDCGKLKSALTDLDSLQLIDTPLLKQHGNPSELNASNAAAALTVFKQLRGEAIPYSQLNAFPGMRRRQSILHQQDGLCVVEDYAHHPKEISALLVYLRERFVAHECVVIFQAHRPSRTLQFKEAFAESLSVVDHLYLLPLYAAYERGEASLAMDSLVHACAGSLRASISPDMTGVRALAERIQVGKKQLFVFIGAGNIDDFARLFTAWVQAKGATDQTWRLSLEGQVSTACKLANTTPLASKTTMRIGGPAAYYAEPSNLTDLRALIDNAKGMHLPVFCLGRGSNVLIADQGFDGLVIRLSQAHWQTIFHLDAQRIWVGAGVRLKALCGFAAKAELAGFEFLEGIPGAVGGALRMNAGAMGQWMFDVVESVLFIDKDNQLKLWDKERFHFGYRKVEEISQGIALGAILRSAKKTPQAAIRSCMDTYANTRKEQQPKGPSAGCIFKNPSGAYAGQLIDQSALKGCACGDAKISDVHANFIVNQGQASASDVINLVHKVQQVVKENSGHQLEPEVLLLGAQWIPQAKPEAEMTS